jgi:phosphoglucosamine mutase
MTTRKLFGTDGLRAPFGVYPLDQPTVSEIGRRLAERLREQSTGEPTQPLVVLGGDTRSSTPVLCRWLASGLAAAGARFSYAGTVPTPAVAVLTRRLGAACGIAVSASHNPQPDNGIKLFDHDGFKWNEEAESELERRLAATPDPVPLLDLAVAEEARALYLETLRAQLPAGRPLAGRVVALDTANGATASYAPALFRGLGAETVVIGNRPNGENINAGCGSTHPEALRRLVVERRCDFGFAFDGDGDRTILADENGDERDGDTILYLWSQWLRRDGALDPPRIVATSMSNLGLERALGASGIAVERCDVGDRAVVATLRREGLLLGGEQSGHIVHLGLGTTGDGLATAAHLACRIAASGRTLAQLLSSFERFPQVLKNVKVREKRDFGLLPAVQEAAARAERRLGNEGRLVLRYSGTEPLARIMIEGPARDLIDGLADDIAGAFLAEGLALD